MSADLTEGGAAQGTVGNTAGYSGKNSQNSDGVGNFYAPVDTVNTPAKTELPSEKFVPPHVSEILLETAIEVAKQRLCDAPTRAEKMEAWREMCGLIDQRTPARRRFMARMAGLQ